MLINEPLPSYFGLSYLHIARLFSDEENGKEWGRNVLLTILSVNAFGAPSVSSERKRHNRQLFGWAGCRLVASKPSIALSLCSSLFRRKIFFGCFIELGLYVDSRALYSNRDDSRLPILTVGQQDLLRQVVAKPMAPTMATSITQPPPFTPAEPVIDVLHGIEIVDPYRWLENQDSPRTRHWIEEQTQYTRAYFDAIPYRNRIRERVADLLSVDVVSEPWNIGDRYVFLKRERNANQPSIVMRKGLNGRDEILVDPANRGTGSSTAVSIAAMSDDGRFLAYSVRQGGTDHFLLEILDIETNTVLRDRLPEGFCSGIAFAPDGSGFYYAHRGLNDPRPHYRAAFWHQFGTQPATDQEILFAGEEPDLFLGILYSREADTLAFAAFFTGKHRRMSLHLKSTRADAKPKLLLQNIEGSFIPFFVSGRLLACTDLGAPNRRIVSIDLDNPAPESWCDVVPECNQRIQQFAIAGEQIFVTRIDRFSTTIDGFGLDGQHQGNITFPPHGTIRLWNRTTTSDKLFFSYTSIHKSPAVYCHDAKKKDELVVWQDSSVPFDSSAISIEEVSYVSKDGTSIPLLLAARKDFLNSGPLPTLLTGYGGFGNCVTPRFTGFATFLIDQGFLFAVPALRGGSELGEQWHCEGKREKRQNSFDDFIAAAEWLVAKGRSAPDRIAIGGGSNAGLLVGAAITQRPDLFRAAICLGPLLDMARYHLFDFAADWADEYGSPEDERDFRSLIAYSPYHQVKDDVVYPAVMFISGDADTRCNPMHTRKMTARLQAANTSEHPILLDYRPNWGHMPVQPLNTRIEALTDRLSFICRELSVKVDPRSCC